jgi:hypothetical protein
MCILRDGYGDEKKMYCTVRYEVVKYYVDG